MAHQVCKPRRPLSVRLGGTASFERVCAGRLSLPKPRILGFKCRRLSPIADTNWAWRHERRRRGETPSVSVIICRFNQSYYTCVVVLLDYGFYGTCYAVLCRWYFHGAVMQSRTAFRLNYVKLSGKPGPDGRDLGKYAMDFMEHAEVLFIIRLRKILIFPARVQCALRFLCPHMCTTHGLNKGFK